MSTGILPPPAGTKLTGLQDVALNAAALAGWSNFLLPALEVLLHVVGGTQNAGSVRNNAFRFPEFQQLAIIFHHSSDHQ